MKLYYVSSDDFQSGKHRVHKPGCAYFPLTYVYLGLCSDAGRALKKARQYYAKVEPCPTCCAPRGKSVFFHPH